LSYIGTYDKTIFYNPANQYCIISIKTADCSIPERGRSTMRHKDHMIRFIAVGYQLPRTDAVELELEGEWQESKYGYQFQVTQWQEIVPKSTIGIESYLSSGLIKGIGPKLAADIVNRFGLNTMEVFEHHPERLLDIKGITENKLNDIKVSYVESRALQNLMTLLAPFKITPQTAQKIYNYFGPASIDILTKSPFELCQIPGFGFKRVDAIVQKTAHQPHDPMRIKGACLYALGDAKRKQGHLFLNNEDLISAALKLLNARSPLPEHRVQKQEAIELLQNLILNGSVVSMKNNIYYPAVFEQEDETARQIARRLIEQPPQESITSALSEIKEQFQLSLSAKQEKAVHIAFQHNLSIITGSPGTGKTTVLKTIIEVYHKLYPDRKISLMAPTGRASRRMAESTGMDEAQTLHSALGLTSEDNENDCKPKEQLLSADLIIVDETSMIDMWLAKQLFSRIKKDARIILVGDADQLPSVGAGNVLYEMIACQLIPVTVLDEIFRQTKDSLIAHNARFINKGNSKLYYGNDFIFIPVDTQTDAAARIIEEYCRKIADYGIEQVQILSPFRSEGEASAEQLNTAIREIVNPFQSTEDEINLGTKSFRVGDRIMQTKNTGKVSNGDLGFIRYMKDTPDGKRIGLHFGENRELEYGAEDLVNLDLAYATTIHKAMGSEYSVIIMPLLKAHSIMLYRNLLYTGITRAKNQVILIGQKSILFMAIHRNEINKRNTLLAERIRLYYKAYARAANIQIPDFLSENLKNAS